MTHPLKEPKKYWDEIWSKDYHADRIKRLDDMADRANTKEYWDNKWLSSKRHVEQWVMNRVVWHIRRSDAKSVLDIGCGNGRTLYMVRDLDCFGIDISEVAIKKMKAKYGVDGIAMDIDDLDKFNRKFDYIICNHTLEHIYRDKKLVKNCYRLLNDGGTFFAAVPNNISGPEETEEHVRKYDGKSLGKLIKNIFGNVELDILGHHLIGIAKKNVN